MHSIYLCTPEFSSPTKAVCIGLICEMSNQNTYTVNKWRVILSQVLASTTASLLIFTIGASQSMVTIIVPVVLNGTDEIILNDHEVSWLGSLAYIFVPIGTLCAGFMMDYFGRKGATVLICIPHIIGYSLLYKAWNVTLVFIGNALLGLGIGLLVSPAVSYVGEISDPSIRGSLLAFANMFASIGAFTVFSLGSILSWRMTAVLCLVAPILAILISLVVPESPVWLISRKRNGEALRSLCWLRGWCSRNEVRYELKLLIDYQETVYQCLACNISIRNCSHRDLNVWRKLLYNIRYRICVKETLRPITFILIYFLFYALSGLQSMRHNLVNICKAMGMNLESRVIIVITGILFIFMNVVTSLLIRCFGKRFVAISAMFACFISNLALAIYSKTTLPSDVYTYNPSSFPNDTSVLPTIFYFLLVCGTGLGLPWLLMSEVFPFKSRGIASGIAASGAHILNFIATKTYLNLEESFRIDGMFIFFATVSVIGVAYLYLYMPETENKTLMEIEEHFGGKSQIVQSCFVKLLQKKRKISNDDEVMTALNTA